MTTGKKIGLISLLIVVVGLSVFVYFRFFFVYKEGVRSGHLNKIERQGVIFKTYEGRIIQTGFHSEQPGTMGTNYFEFSVVDDSIANKLMLTGEKEIGVRYKQYFGTLPWRGNSKCIVYKIENVAPSQSKAGETDLEDLVK